MPPFEHTLVPRDWRLSSFPRDLIPYTLQACPSKHTFPPVTPSFFDRLKTKSPPDPADTPTADGPRRSARGHASSASSNPPGSLSLGGGRTRGLTPSTHELLRELGTIRFYKSSTKVRDLIEGVVPPMLAAVSELEHHLAEIALDSWHDGLRTQEGTLWMPVERPVSNPATYAQRVVAGLQLPAGVDPVMPNGLPENENGVTTSILAPSLKRLVHDFFLLCKVEVLSKSVDVAPEVGSGTSDIALKQPSDVGDEEWKDVEKFLVKVKLLSPLDWCTLLNVLSEESEGFRLLISAGDLSTDLDIPSVWSPVLAQIVEELHVNRAKYLILCDYERYLLFTLDSPTSISVSELIYRDRHHMPADSSLHHSAVDRSSTPMELVMALVLLAKRSANPEDLWTDLAALKEAHRARLRKGEEKSLDRGGSGRKRQKRSLSGHTRGSSTSSAAMSLAVTLGPHMFLPHDSPAYAVSPLRGTVSGKLELPSSEHQLVDAVIALCHEVVSPGNSFGSDHAPSLTWSSTSEDSTAPPFVELKFEQFLGGGRTWDGYEGTLAVGLPGGEVSPRLPVVLKHVELTTLEKFAQAQAGYPELTRVLRAVDSEAHILRWLESVAPGIAPRPYALWHGVKSDHIVFAIEDCGAMIAPTAAALHALDLSTKRAVVDAYARVHAAGVLHNDVAARHLLRDSHGRIRIIDWEGARHVGQAPAGRAAVQAEMLKVCGMLGME